MSHIEFLGPPGSGKTTLYKEVCDESMLYRPFIRFNKDRTRTREINIHFHEKVKNALRFLRHRPAYARLLIQASRNATYEPFYLIKMLLGTAAEYEYAVNNRTPMNTIMLDEGFMQRALSISLRTSPNTDNLETYLNIIPLPSILIYVDAKSTTCVSRQQDRNKDSSSKPWVETGNPVNVLDEIRKDCAHIADNAERHGVTVIKIKNNGTISDSTNRIQQEIREFLK